MTRPDSTPGVVVDVWYIADGGSYFDRYEASQASLTHGRDRPTLYLVDGRLTESRARLGRVSVASYGEAPRILIRPADVEGQP